MAKPLNIVGAVSAATGAKGHPRHDKTKQYDTRHDANTEAERPGTELKLLLAFILSS